jgi:tRNA-2-methylthio-N6-dimethylallyladenosine synthase
LYGRNSQNVVAVFPKGDIQVGDYVDVIMKECTSITLNGDVVAHYPRKK